MSKHQYVTGGVAALSLAVVATLGSAPAGQAADGRRDPSQIDRFTGPRFQAPRVAVRSGVPRLKRTRWDDSAAVDARVRQLLAQMTTAEKADLATGQLNNNYGFYNNPITRLGIPALTMADGPIGVRVADPGVDQRSTQLSSGSSLAATFDRRLARAYGTVLGVESFHTGHNVLLGPTLDITRTPLWGRSFEGFGEDPLVSGTMGTGVTSGIQSQPVLATLKHPFAYNQETDRFDADARVSERALQEVYARPLGIVQRAAHPGAMMCSFNKVNGTHSCENPLLTTILKRQMRFRGFVMSDYNATPSTVQAANAGLDQEQPGDQGPGSANFGDRLVAAVQAGQVTMARLDDMAARILRPMIGLGLLDRPPSNSAFPVAANSATARRIAARGMVLLKNARRVLPLRRGSIAVIGPDADNISAQGGGSSENTHPTASVSPLEGIRAAAGGRSVTYAPGVDGISEGDLLPGAAPVPASVLTPAAGATGQGLSAQYWSNASFDGAPHLSQVDPNVNVNFGFQNFPGFNAASPKIPTVRGDFALLGDLSARWTGALTAPATATYTLGLTARGNATLYVDDQPFVQHTGDLSSVGKQIRLTAGQRVSVRIEYAAPALNSYQGGQVRLFWQHPESVLAPKMQQAVATARRARIAVVVVRDYETEGVDRPSLALPKEQEQLIRRVAAVNRRTVVVVETGAVSRISPWIRGVRGVIQAWYPGQEQGNAIADVLFGRVNPSGHLPATLPRNERQVPSIRAGVVPFTEGVFVGYRGFLRRHVHPSRPFGYGLSYTTFRYSGLRAHRVRGGIAVTFQVRNVGRRAGIDVPQVYTGPRPRAGSPRQLAGFRAVRVRAGGARTVRLVLPRESFSRWSVDRDRWVTIRGRVPVRLAHSATQVVATRTVLIRR